MAVTSAEAGVPLADFLDRAVCEALVAVHAAVAAVNMGLPVSVPVPPLPSIRPGDPTLTLAAWEESHGSPWLYGPQEPLNWIFGPHQRADIEYATERALRRAVIDWLDGWGRGDLELWGRGADGARVQVPRDLRHSCFMVLLVRENLLKPASWRGQAPPAALQPYHELTVRPVQAAVGKDAARQEGGERQPTRAEAARNRKKMTNEESNALDSYRAREDVPPSGERQYAHYTSLRKLDSALPWLKRWMFKDTKAPPGPKSSPRSSRQK